MPDPFQLLPNDLRSIVLSHLPTRDRLRVREVSHTARGAVENTGHLVERFRREVGLLETKLADLERESAAYTIATAAVIAVMDHPQRHHWITVGSRIVVELTELETKRANLARAFQNVATHNAAAAVQALGVRLNAIGPRVAALMPLAQGRLADVENATIAIGFPLNLAMYG